MATKQASQAITLRGSANMVTEFFGFAINSVLYQRGIYPPEQFERVKKYGLTLLTTGDESLKRYVNNILTQLNTWLMEKTIQKVVLVISSSMTSEVMERWQFDIECDKSMDENSVSNKTEKEIHAEIQGILRQITASVSFLPLIDDPCAFEILIYTDKDVLTPETWEESDAKLVPNAAEVFPLRSFSTNIHAVKSSVMYRRED